MRAVQARRGSSSGIERKSSKDEVVDIPAILSEVTKHATRHSLNNGTSPKNPGKFASQGSLTANDPEMLTALRIIQRREAGVVERETLGSVLKMRAKERNSCLSLPFSLMFFMFYCIVVSQHEDVFMIFQAERAVREFIDFAGCDGSDHQSVFEANTALEVWQWLSNSVACDGSLWFQQKDMAGRPLPRQEWGRLLGSHRMIGGLLVEQVRTERAPCEATMAFNWNCYPTDKRSTNPFGEEYIHWTNRTEPLPGTSFIGEGFTPLFTPEEAETVKKGFQGRRLERIEGTSVMGWGVPGESKSQIWERFIFFLMEHSTVEELKEKVRYLEHGGWIDSNTEQIVVKALFVNAEVALVTRVSLLFRFMRTGGLDVSLRLETSPMVVYRNPVLGPMADFFWLFLLGIIAWQTVREVLAAYKGGTGRRYLADLWNWLDLGTIFLGSLVVIGFMVQRGAVKKLFDKMLEANATDPPPTNEITREYLQEIHTMHQVADWVFRGTMWYRLLLGDYVLLVMLRFFKAFRAQPRLALVTTTIYAAGADLFHFSIVFVSIFTSFAFASVVLFGRRMQEFSTFPQAAATCFAIVCGDFDGAWHQVASEHPVTAFLWFWSFIILIFFVMLNMVLAIVLDIYTEVRTTAVSGDPLWIQVGKLFQDLRAGGPMGLIRTRKLEEQALEHVGKMNNEVAHEDILQVCPEMERLHIDEIFGECMRLEKRAEAKGLCLSDALMIIGMMHTDVKNIQETLGNLVPSIELKFSSQRSSGASKTSNSRVGDRRGSGLGRTDSTASTVVPLTDSEQASRSEVAVEAMDGLWTALKSSEFEKLLSKCLRADEEREGSKSPPSQDSGSDKESTEIEALPKPQKKGRREKGSKDSAQSRSKKDAKDNRRPNRSKSTEGPKASATSTEIQQLREAAAQVAEAAQGAAALVSAADSESLVQSIQETVQQEVASIKKDMQEVTARMQQDLLQALSSTLQSSPLFVSQTQQGLQHSPQPDPQQAPQQVPQVMQSLLPQQVPEQVSQQAAKGALDNGLAAPGSEIDAPIPSSKAFSQQGPEQVSQQAAKGAPDNGLGAPDDEIDAPLAIPSSNAFSDPVANEFMEDEFSGKPSTASKSSGQQIRDWCDMSQLLSPPIWPIPGSHAPGAGVQPNRAPSPFQDNTSAPSQPGQHARQLQHSVSQPPPPRPNMQTFVNSGPPGQPPVALVPGMVGGWPLQHAGQMPFQDMPFQDMFMSQAQPQMLIQPIHRQMQSREVLSRPDYSGILLSDPSAAAGVPIFDSGHVPDVAAARTPPSRHRPVKVHATETSGAPGGYSGVYPGHPMVSGLPHANNAANMERQAQQQVLRGPSPQHHTPRGPSPQHQNFSNNGSAGPHGTYPPWANIASQADRGSNEHEMSIRPHDPGHALGGSDERRPSHSNINNTARSHNNTSMSRLDSSRSQ